ncbi:hypothetical protein IJG21_00420 [Candidatus Saccharibacteria bacterium]|nr:hypothetical protein [Candidatus Saccharibacteria bacterium]
MANTNSKKAKKQKNLFKILRLKLSQIKSRKKVSPHKSFRRSYREDYTRDLEIPGLLSHALSSFKIIFKNWKLFLPFLLIMVAADIFLVGIMSESSYVNFQTVLEETNTELADGKLGNFAKAGLLLVSTVTSGGLSSSLSESQQIFAVIVFLLIWLITIYLLRHLLAGHKIKLRDGFYNALTPLVSTFVVLMVAFLQAIPILIVVITYSAAVTTEFLSTPFYALIYFIFASLMLILSGYLLSSSLIALVAVTAPGLYPLPALKTASDLMMSRRIRFIIRLLYLIFVLALTWVVVMMPIITLDLWLKSFVSWLEGVPVVPFCLLLMTCFSFIYVSVYLYLYYRRLLDYDKKSD